jgi:hypothetical protein
MKTITKTQFRVLLTASIAAMIASTVMAVLADHWLLPQHLRDYLAAHRTDRPEAGEIVINTLAVPGVLAGVIAIIGLYRFRPSARWLAVAAWAYMLAWMPFSRSAVIESPFSGALSQCSTLLAGAVLAVIYFSPAADWFRSDGSPNPQGGANGRQPFSSETDQASAAAASRRSP